MPLKCGDKIYDNIQYTSKSEIHAQVKHYHFFFRLCIFLFFSYTLLFFFSFNGVTIQVA